MKNFFHGLLLLLLSCSGNMGFAYQEKIVGNYYLIAIDNIDQCGISYHKPSDGPDYGLIITETVFAVGYNNNFMIIKQHPRTWPSPPNKKITNYYILPIKNEMNWRTNNGLIGPLTEGEFIENRKKLQIPETLSFTKVIKELE